MVDINKMISDENVKFIDIKYSDLAGILRHVTLPVSYLEKALSNGVGFDGSSVVGFSSSGKSDLIVKPDIETAHLDRLSEIRTLSFVGNIYNTDGTRFKMDPRYILEQTINYLKKQKICDKVKFLPELEFYIFRNIEVSNDKLNTYVRIDSDEQDIFKSYGGKSYHADAPRDLYFNFRSYACELLEEMGIKVKYHHHEVGRYSQHEIELQFDTALKTADNIQIAKYYLKNLALNNDLILTFMPKPIYNEAGNGLHFHQYLEKDGVSIFGDKKNILSDIGLNYIGGIIKHGRSIAAITNPSTNSYRRLNSGFEAPVNLQYSEGCRETAIRIPAYIKDIKSIDIEFRPPDATSNPYLAITSMLLAGIDGIKNKIDPGAPAVYGRSYKRVKRIPLNLDEALSELQKDNKYLTDTGVVDGEFIKKWLEIKRIESATVSFHPHPFEFEIYF